MAFFRLRAVVLALSAALAGALIAGGASAQTPDPKAAPQAQPAQPGEAPRNGGPTARRIDEIGEVGKAITGPAANPECVWLGRRVVSLLWRDDLDTAFRHLDLYDRFGCPGGHVQATFRCVVRQGNIDPKAPETLNARVQACWINPSLAATLSPPPPAAPEKSEK